MHILAEISQDNFSLRDPSEPRLIFQKERVKFISIFLVFETIAFP